MTDIQIRPWCAKAVYPGLKEFVIGTIVLPVETSSVDVEKALYEHALTFLPVGFKLIEPICGAIFFVPEEDFRND